VQPLAPRRLQECREALRLQRHGDGSQDVAIVVDQGDDNWLRCAEISHFSQGYLGNNTLNPNGPSDADLLFQGIGLQQYELQADDRNESDDDTFTDGEDYQIVISPSGSVQLRADSENIDFQFDPNLDRFESEFTGRVAIPPFGLMAPEMAGWLQFGGGQALWDEAYAPFGILPFYAGSSGVQAGGWLNREINTLDDLKGLRFRIAGLGGEVMRRLGVSVVLTPPGEIFSAMQNRTIDAAEWVGPWNDMAFGLDKVAKYYYLPAFHEAGPALELLVNKQKFNTLPADLQDIVRGAAMASAAEALADFTFHNIEAFALLTAEGGPGLREWPEPVAAEIARVSGEVLAELAASSELAGRVAASHDAYLAKARRWSTWSDAAMLGLRNRHPVE
jgi:hypothetical protein